MMSFSKHSLALTCFMALALVLPSHAQNSPQDYLDAHNAARAAVGVFPLTWDDNLAAYAQNYADSHVSDCLPKHSWGPYGENVAVSPHDISGIDAVRGWVDEKAKYDYASNTCAPNAVCGHYKQVVWRDSVRMGCAKVRCRNGGTFICCCYDPKGNNIGEIPY